MLFHYPTELQRLILQLSSIGLLSLPFGKPHPRKLKKVSEALVIPQNLLQFQWHSYAEETQPSRTGISSRSRLLFPLNTLVIGQGFPETIVTSFVAASRTNSPVNLSRSRRHSFLNWQQHFQYGHDTLWGCIDAAGMTGRSRSLDVGAGGLVRFSRDKLLPKVAGVPSKVVKSLIQAIYLPSLRLFIQNPFIYNLFNSSFTNDKELCSRRTRTCALE